MFVPFESLDEIANCLNGILQENKFKLQEEKDKMLFTITMVFNEKKYDITIEVPHVSNQHTDILLDICETINQMKKSLDTIDNRIIKLETDLKHKKDKYTVIELLDRDFQDEIASTISNEYIDFKLIYKTTRDGDIAQLFHSHCDDKAGTLVVIKTTKDIVFGGYTSVTWNSINNNKSDPKAFVFSNTLKKIYPIKDKDSYSIYAHNSYGPTFGKGHDICVSYKCLTSTANSVNACSYADYSGYELNNNESHFTVKELEVFAIIYYNTQ